MYKNQYIISTRELENRALDLEKLCFFDNIHIYSNQSLDVVTAKNEGVQVAMVGYIINPFIPADSNHTIIEKLAKQCATIGDLFKEAEKLSGRYVLLYKNESSFVVTGDACHLRQIYYGFDDGHLVITSSEKLFLDAFNHELKTTEEKLAIFQMPVFLKEEHGWYGDEAYDDRLTKLLPNLYLDINEKAKKRLPVFPQKFSSQDDIIEYVSLILKNTISALNRRYKIRQPVTSGLDSRILLAASKDVKEDIKYFVFGNPKGDHPDIWVPKNLSEEYGLDFQVVNPSELREDFLVKFRKEFVFPRVLPKTAHIQYHYDSNKGYDGINLNGNCSEITRQSFGHISGKVSLDMIFTFNKYKGKIPYFNERLEEWYPGAKQFSEDFGIPLLDLNYWEQRIGNWHALWQYEQDIAIEESSPFNHRGIINALLQVPANERKSPKYTFFIKLVSRLWPEVLSEPINPGNKGTYIQRLVKGSARAKYIGRKLKAFLYSD